MPRWSGRKAQVEPVAALAAVAVLGLALAGYAVAYGDAVREGASRDLAEPAVAPVLDALRPDGVARPARLERARSAGPDGYRTNLTLVAGNRSWTAGPPSPPSADAAERAVAVRIEPGRVLPGRLRVTVWP